MSEIDLSAEFDALRRAVTYGCEHGHGTLIVRLSVLKALLAAEAESSRLFAALAPLHDQLRRFVNAGKEYSRCALHLEKGTEAETLARAFLGLPDAD